MTALEIPFDGPKHLRRDSVSLRNVRSLFPRGGLRCLLCGPPIPQKLGLDHPGRGSAFLPSSASCVSIWVPKLVARSPKLFDQLPSKAMSTTKHVKFSEDAAFPPPAAEQPRTNAFAVHPDRLAAVEAASSQAKAVEKKTKTKVSWEILKIQM